MDKTKIDWCDSSWNPITGCLHGCKYCYARGIANRFSDPQRRQALYLADDFKYDTTIRQEYPYPYGFRPTFHRYRLNDYKDKSGRIIFVGSMTDMFGDWVPDEWIEKVFKACEAAPQHKYLFLTKNPSKWAGLFEGISDEEMENWWFGQSLTTLQHHDYVWAVPRHFLSIEPLLSEPCENISLFGTSWVIVGAETGKRKNKVIPRRKWVEEIVYQCRAASIPVFMKESLRELMGDDFIQEWPAGLVGSTDHDQ